MKSAISIKEEKEIWRGITKKYKIGTLLRKFKGFQVYDNKGDMYLLNAFQIFRMMQHEGIWCAVGQLWIDAKREEICTIEEMNTKYAIILRYVYSGKRRYITRYTGLSSPRFLLIENPPPYPTNDGGG